MGLQDQDTLKKTYTASGTIRIYRGVKLTSTVDTVEECDTQGEAIWGIAENAATDGGRVDVRIGPGIAKLEIGADVTLNADLAVATDGQFTDNDGSNDYLVAKALEDGTAANERITVYLYEPAHLDQVGN